jgi:membrane-associated phospholipid phosphatase
MYGLVLLLKVNPYTFSLADEKAEGLLIISVALLTIIFPLISILMMRQLGLISSFKMEERTDRIGPLIVTSLFYLWLFVNVRQNSGIPESFSFLLLGSIIGLFAALFLNSFTKISLHSIGLGGFLGGLAIIRFKYSYDSFFINIGQQILRINVDLVLVTAVIITGLVGTSRLILKAHTPDQVYGGYLVGFLAQIVAFWIAV